MPEVAEQKQPEAVASEAPKMANNPFDDNSWKSAPPQQTQQQEPPKLQEPVNEPNQLPNTAKTDDEVVYVDPNEYLEQQLGYKSWDEAKAELQQLRDKAQTPAEIKFANEQSKKFFEAIKEGKTDDIYSYLHQQRQLDRLEKLDLTNIEAAQEIIKANLQFKYKELTPKQIERLYNRDYALPDKPRQSIEENEEDYNQRVEEWKIRIQEKQEDILISANIARPELLKFKSELVLPDISKTNPTQQQPDPKVLEAVDQAARDMFLKTLDSEFNKFTGYETKVIDESVELPVMFTVPDNEKLAYANKLKNFDINNFFGERWFPNGQPNVNQMMADLYLLENPAKVLQGISNNAASARMDNYIKTKKNVKVDGDPSSTSVSKQTAQEMQLKQEEAMWNA